MNETILISIIIIGALAIGAYIGRLLTGFFQLVLKKDCPPL
jgi:hypothetical protein